MKRMKQFVFAALGMFILGVVFASTAMAQDITYLGPQVITPPEKIWFEGPEGPVGITAGGTAHQGSATFEFRATPVGTGPNGGTLWEGVVPAATLSTTVFAVDGGITDLFLHVQKSDGEFVQAFIFGLQMVDPIVGPRVRAGKKKITATCDVRTTLSVNVSLEVSLEGQKSKKKPLKAVRSSASVSTVGSGPCQIQQRVRGVKRCMEKYLLCQSTGTVSVTTSLDGAVYPLGPLFEYNSDTVTFKGKKK